MHTFTAGDWVWHPVHKVKMQVVRESPISGDLLCEWKDHNGGVPSGSIFRPPCCKAGKTTKANGASEPTGLPATRPR